jgi:hypothetical protein
MTQPFAPQEHLIKIPRRVKTASGAWETVHDDYLEVKFRLVMFREKYPHGRITTEEVCVDLDRGYARFADEETRRRPRHLATLKRPPDDR